MQIGILGSGSWGTALAKLLTDNHHAIHWWNRSRSAIEAIMAKGHNPNYLPTASFDTSKLHLSTQMQEVIEQSEVIVVAIPSAFAEGVLGALDRKALDNKIIVSAIKGILPGNNQLLNDFLKSTFDFSLENYVTVMGPCHAEEVAAQK
ncbi:MAG: NAD(P)-binding domain-containing protein, partial [Ferruginibacter sp.]|nr:NAD(P)-binding domain-containing protein [Ferruginibacter sp.]